MSADFIAGVVCGAGVTLIAAGIALVGVWLRALVSGEGFIPR